jgi:hypothetical protein
MGLFRRGVKPELLTVPRGSEVLLPDARVTPAEQPPTSARLPIPIVGAVARLTLALTERWWPGHTDSDRLKDIIFERTVLGAAFALIEQQQGRAVPGEVNPLVTAAIAWQQTAVPERSGDLPDDVNYRCGFTLRAGYYLARVGEDEMRDLVANSDYNSSAGAKDRQRDLSHTARPARGKPNVCRYCDEPIEPEPGWKDSYLHQLPGS